MAAMAAAASKGNTRKNVSLFKMEKVQQLLNVLIKDLVQYFYFIPTFSKAGKPSLFYELNFKKNLLLLSLLYFLCI